MSVTLSFVLLLVAAYANAATSPSLGLADTFGILSSTYTNTAPGMVINGDLGYTTGPAVSPTVNGTTYTPGATYTQAGIDQGAALADLNSEVCTFTFPAGAVDLASNAQFPTATYAPGVYCITGAVTVGAGGITLTGSGTYIFRMTGALDTVAGSVITLGPGASECDIWWTPIGATTLGANSTFRGTVIDDAAITVGSTVTWVGRALSFGGTVTTAVDTITAPSCAAPAPTASLTVTKTVVNDDGGTMTVSDFPLFVGGLSVTSGVATTTLAPGTYTVSETGDAGYAASVWGGDCAADGTITLADGDDLECTITNDDIAAVVSEEDSSGGGGSSGGGSRRVRTASPEGSATATPTLAAPPAVPEVPGLPNTGLGPADSTTSAVTLSKTRLTIPNIGVDAEIESLGLTPTGAMDTPEGPNNVGWYSLGVRPGEMGSAVIGGHRGWKNGESAVFDDLDRLKKGDSITVTDTHGETHIFIVSETRVYDRSDIVPEVFISNGGAYLNLITCIGIWNDELKSSQERLVVFADLAP